MDSLHIFFGEFWPGFIIAAAVFFLIWLGRVVSLDQNASSLSPKYFKELHTFPKEVQKQLLRAADRQAFSGWRSAIPALCYSALLSGSIAMVRTLRKVGAIPDSFWFGMGVTLLIFVLGGWISRRLETSRTRPFLRSLIELQQTKSK